MEPNLKEMHLGYQSRRVYAKPRVLTAVTQILILDRIFLKQLHEK